MQEVFLCHSLSQFFLSPRSFDGKLEGRKLPSVFCSLLMNAAKAAQWQQTLALLKDMSGHKTWMDAQRVAVERVLLASANGLELTRSPR